MLLAADPHGAAVNQCLISIAKIRSHDVVAQVRYVTYDSSKDEDVHTKAGLEETTRDVFAVDQGRRIERRLGSDRGYSVSVLDWRSAQRQRVSLESCTVRLFMPGPLYHDYLNPVVGGRLLTELLSSPDTRINPLPPPNPPGTWIGMELKTRRLPGTVLQLWLDTSHGCLPVKLDRYRERDGSLVLVTRLQIEEFLQVDAETWAPARGLLNPLVIETIRETALLAVVRERSTWNQPLAETLFTAAGMPPVNFERDGWKHHYPKETLAMERTIDAIHRRQRLTQLGLWALVTLVLATPALYLYRRRLRR